jgi:hypothetical protein
MHFFNRYLIPIFFLGLLIPRIVVLMSAEMLPDLDEAAIGIHVQNLLKGIPVSVYFPGQAHNFILLEMLVLAPLSLLFPGSLLILKIAPLIIFLGAMYFLIKSVEPDRRAIVSFLLIILCTLPPVILWSMKLRGGYVPALFFACLIIWLKSRPRPRALWDFLIGAALFWMIVSHFLVAAFLLLPIIYYYFKIPFRKTEIIPGILGGLVGWGTTFIGKTPSVLYPADTSGIQLFPSGFDLASDLIVFLSGKWSFFQYDAIHWFSIIYVLISLFLARCLFALEGLHRVFIFLAFAGFILFYTLLHPFPLRYFIPLTWAFVVFIALVPLKHIAWRLRAFLIIPLFIAVFSDQFTHTHLQFEGNNSKAVKEIHLATKDFVSVFVEDESLAYLLNYTGNRSVHYRARPAYSRFQRDWYDGEMAINNAEKVGLLMKNNMGYIPVDKEIHGWSLYHPVDLKLLESLNFEMKPL